MSVILTAKAVSAVKRLIAEAKEKGEFNKEADLALRFAVIGGGCSGFSYRLGFVDTTKLSVLDKVYETDGVKVVVDIKSSLYVDGTTIDYEDGLNGKGFVFNNPGEQGRCGCGQSFNI